MYLLMLVLTPWSWSLHTCVLYTQRRNWLREVFASQSENSPVKRLVGNMQVLHIPCDSEEDVERHTNLLDETLSLCEDIDLAMGEHSWSRLCQALTHTVVVPLVSLS